MIIIDAIGNKCREGYQCSREEKNYRIIYKPIIYGYLCNENGEAK